MTWWRKMGATVPVVLSPMAVEKIMTAPDHGLCLAGCMESGCQTVQGEIWPLSQ
jgi:hypothetical protein